MIKKLISKVYLVANIIIIIWGSVYVYKNYFTDVRSRPDTFIVFKNGWLKGFVSRHNLTDTTYTVEQLKKYHSIDSTKLDSILNN